MMKTRLAITAILSCVLLLCLGAGVAAAQKATVIRVAHVEAEDRSTHKSLLKFKEYVEKESGGRLEVQIFPNALLGGDKEAIEGVEMGNVQMCLPGVTVLASYDKEFGLVDLPFLFDSEEAIFNAMDGEVGAYLNKKIEKLGLVNFGYNYNGPRCISNNVRPITQPEDLKGVKIRVPQSPVFIDTFKALGTNATPMGFGEVFTALQQGTVDGQENAPSLVYASKFNEVQKYFSLTNHSFGLMAVLMSQDFVNKMPEDLRAIMVKGIDEYLIKYQRNLEQSETNDYIQKLKDSGMEVNAITPENHQKFVEAVQSVYSKNIPKPISQELFDMAVKYNKSLLS